ncbi:hypothetical protein XENOCAPTIV_018965 [Xenoophorus captivus]|uniref:Uncharacterized protein n=1 Tax=Xenoophorus captivus TaxID=1517983 RepID=A0ABV0RRJ1_9TELE
MKSCFAMTDDLTKVEHAIAVLEKKVERKYIPTCAHFTSEKYKAFPMFDLIVSGKKVSFMVTQEQLLLLLRQRNFQHPQNSAETMFFLCQHQGRQQGNMLQSPSYV